MKINKLLLLIQLKYMTLQNMLERNGKREGKASGKMIKLLKENVL